MTMDQAQERVHRAGICLSIQRACRLSHAALAGFFCAILLLLSTNASALTVTVTPANRKQFERPIAESALVCMRRQPDRRGVLGTLSTPTIVIGSKFKQISVTKYRRALVRRRALLAKLKRAGGARAERQAAASIVRFDIAQKFCRSTPVAVVDPTAPAPAGDSPTPGATSTPSTNSSPDPAPTVNVGYSGAEELGGWTEFGLAADSRIIYVSSSSGTDSNDGLSQLTPKRTIAAGFSLVRHGYSDRLLLRRGDVFNEHDIQINKGGRSQQEPLVIGAYGDSSVRPLIKTGNGGGFHLQGNEGYLDHIAIIGLHLIANYRRPLDPDFKTGHDGMLANVFGVDAYIVGGGLTIEDCRFEYFTYGLNILSINLQGPTRTHDVVIRRNVINNSYDTQGHSQGIFLGRLNRALLEENVLVANGYNHEIPQHQRILSPNQDLSVWRQVVDGRFRIGIDCQNANVCNYINVADLDFTEVTSFDDIAIVMQNRINAILGRSGLKVTNWRSPNGQNLILLNSNNNDPMYGLSFVSGVGTYTGTTPGIDLNNDNFLPGRNGQTNETIFNHNLYSYADDLRLVRNISAQASSHGFKLQPMLGTGTIENNLLIQNSISMQLGGLTDFETGVDMNATRNVVVEGKDMNSSSAGLRGWGIDMVNVEHGLIQYNVIAHKLSASTEHAIGFGPDVVATDAAGPKALDVKNVLVNNNIIYNWSGSIEVKTPRTRSNYPGYQPVYENLRFTNNVVQDLVPGVQTALVGLGAVDRNQVSFFRNTYYSFAPIQNWFSVIPVSQSTYINMSMPQWTGAEEPTAHVEAPLFPDPSRTIGTFMSDYVGTKLTTQDFLEAVKLQSRSNWQPMLTAPVVNHYIREGFGLGGVDIH